jgi:hypothetical protein
MKKLRLRSRKPRLTAVGIRCADHATHSTRKFGTNFAGKRRSLGLYSSLADYGHGVIFIGHINKREGNML